MSAPRITAEEIAAHEQRLADEDITFDFVRGILDDLKSALSELDRLSAQGGEVPPIPYEDAQVLKRNCKTKDHLIFGTLQWAREHARPPPPQPHTVVVPPPGFEISEYAAIHHPGMLHGLLKICKRGPGAWAAFVDDTSCMGRDGKVYYEPRPSNRTPEFVALTRFETPAEAADALRAQAQECDE